jgi:hypothetical protein
MLIGFVLMAQEPNGKFGEVTVRIEREAEEQIYTVERALLYRNVSVSFDTSALVQSKYDLSLFYYPQFTNGKGNILRLILETPEEDNNDYYDFFVNLGDSLPQRVGFEMDSSRIFMIKNGTMSRDSSYTNKISGYFLFIKGIQNEEIVSGEFNLDFEFTSSVNRSSATAVHMEGVLDVPIGRYKEASLSSEAPDKYKKKRLRQNLLVAGAVSAIFLAIFIFK